MALEVDPNTTSRVELEHYAIKLLRVGGRDVDVEAIRAELAGRVWQNHNPYAGAHEALDAGRAPVRGAPLP